MSKIAWKQMKSSIDKISKIDWWLAHCAVKWIGRDAIEWVLREENIMNDLGSLEKYNLNKREPSLEVIEKMIEAYMMQVIHAFYEEVQVSLVPVKESGYGDLVTVNNVPEWARSPIFSDDYPTETIKLNEYFVLGKRVLAGYGEETKTLVIGIEQTPIL